MFLSHDALRPEQEATWMFTALKTMRKFLKSELNKMFSVCMKPASLVFFFVCWSRSLLALLASLALRKKKQEEQDEIMQRLSKLNDWVL